MNYTQALEYMKKAAQRGSVLGTERVTELLRLLGDPQDKVRTVHVSGTNGKGSFGAMLTSILRCAGYRTGGFSSPALTGVTDSFRIDCEEINEEEFASVIGRIAPVCESMAEKPTEFEVLAAAAFELFVQRGCDIAVVECGMGGDLDATNVMKAPLLSVITNVQKDHSAFLGDTIAEIAFHKSGIIKTDCPVFFGGSDETALRVVQEAAREKNAPLYLPQGQAELVSADLDGAVFRCNGAEYRLSLTGSYQLQNAVNVLSCVDILRSRGVEIPEAAVREGLENTRWHGRFEVISRTPVIIFDGAHNPDGIRCAAESIRLHFPGQKISLLIGVMADKEYELYAEMLGELISCVFAVTPDNPRSLDSQTLAGSFSQKGIPSCAFHELETGVRTAYEYAKKHGIPLIALGSLYMYKEFIQCVMRNCGSSITH